MVTCHRKRRRVVVCVDGTWFKPDGEEGTKHRNFTNIFRIFSVVKASDGIPVNDERDELDLWEQKKKYWPGVGTNSSLFGKTVGGACGIGVEDLIRDVYEYCCREATLPTDEIFMFGYSRGAYVVRAVAGLLHSIQAIKSTPQSFKQDYEKGLRVYQDLKLDDGPRQPGECAEFITSTTRESAKVKFVGCFDTVKACFRTDTVLHDISVMDSVAFYRQALAMNEQRTCFTPETLTRGHSLSDLHVSLESSPPSSDFLDAWFIGTHADLGGSMASDGLSLYPLQWVLSEAEKAGLVQGFQMHVPGRPLMSNIREVIFPFKPADVSGGYEPESIQCTNVLDMGLIRTRNGIKLNMWDMRPSHTEKQYLLRINVATFLIGNLEYEEAPRKIFEDDRLIGYRRDAAIGTFIHPSVYLLPDHYPHLRLGQRLGCFNQQLERGRTRYGFDMNEYSWPREEDFLPYHMDHARILVCGENGVGKSTLINRVFGITVVHDRVTHVSYGEHGQHDINKELKHPSHDRVIIHDSCGFQPSMNSSGNENEVQTVHEFLQHRLQHEKFDERLQVIWYCVDISKPRPTVRADKELFSAIDASNSSVPIVLVLTKKDDFLDKTQFRLGKELKKSRPGLTEDERDAIVTDKAHQALMAEAERFKTKFRAETKSPLLGPVTTGDDDDESYEHLLAETLRDVPKRVYTLIVAAQTRNVHLKRQLAIETGMDLFRIGTRTSMIPIPLTTTIAQGTCGYLICERGLKSFGLDNINVDMVWTCIKNNWEGSLAAFASQLTVGLACAAAFLSFPPSLLLFFASDVITSASTVTRQARVLVFCILDIVLILDRAFWRRAELEHRDGAITDEDVRTASTWYQGIVGGVHNRIKERLPVLSLTTNNTVFRSLHYGTNPG